MLRWTLSALTISLAELESEKLCGSREHTASRRIIAWRSLRRTRQTGRMTIEMKRFSALLKLQFPAIGPGGEPGQNRLRYTMLPAE